MDKYEQYWKLSEAEQRFNDSQAGVRALASAWLLGSVGAIGFLLTSEPETSWLLPVALLVVLVATLGCVGLLTLWALDQLIFHRLLNSIFLVGLKHEFDDPSLPPIRAVMMKAAEDRGMHHWQGLFYLLPMMTFPLLSVFVLLGSRLAMGPRGLRAAIALIICQVTAVGWVLGKKKTIAFAKRAAMFGDAEFSAIIGTDPKNSKYELIIARYKPSGVPIERGATPSAVPSE